MTPGVIDQFSSERLQERLPDAYRMAEAVWELASGVAQKASAVENHGGVDFRRLSARGSQELGLFDLLGKLELVLSSADVLPIWISCIREEMGIRGLGLGPILDAYSGASPKELSAAFDFVLFNSILEEVYTLYPAFRKFSSQSQEVLRERFQALDKEIFSLHARKLAANLARVPIPLGSDSGSKKNWTDLHLIENECGKKKSHIALRDLLNRASGAIQSMKPCWMLSPSSVAQHLRPDILDFDVLVIDEASQLRPEEAIGAIARTKQIIVVGDPQQLPPTSFFERENRPLDDDEAEEMVDSESILDLGLATYKPNRELRWHYRSKHESLIAFSNKEFYDDSLVIFPCAQSGTNDYGVEYQYVGGLYTPKAGINVEEAKALTIAALRFMREHPNRSIGLVTVNQYQRDLLIQEVELATSKDGVARAYLERWESTLEPFFVKNLENVQGDERDVILISTVYGRTAPGARVMQRFGPINTKVGHRRLNVLFTRARERVRVFSSLQPSDIEESDYRGVRVFKSYLQYAKDGKLRSFEYTDKAPDSDFEVFVASRLQNRLDGHGLKVVAQVGVSGYFIDLAVKDASGNFILGIECDGAMYHSAKSARDRDRLRQEILEHRGWRIYRIWSTDWFEDPDRETEKLVSFIRTLH